MSLREELGEALFEALLEGKGTGLDNLKAKLETYEKRFPITVRKMPPLCQELFTAMHEAIDFAEEIDTIDLDDLIAEAEAEDEGCPECGTTECVNAGLDKKDVSHPCGYA
jgi:hypothetical protein